MVPHTQTLGIAGEEEQHSSSGAESWPTRSAAMELAASLHWLPATPSSDTFPIRCQNLAEEFNTIFDKVDAVFAGAPDSEDLLWLRDNAQQLRSATRGVAADLGPLTNLPHVARKSEVVPRVLAIAEAFFEETDSAFNENKFAEFCIAFEEISPLQFHEIGALVPALKLVLLEQIAASGR